MLKLLTVLSLWLCIACALRATRVTHVSRGRQCVMHIAHDHHQHSDDTSIASPSLADDARPRSLSSFGRAIRLLRVPLVRGVFAAALITSPALIRRKLSSQQLLLAAIAALALAIFDDAKAQVRSWMGRVKVLQSSLQKHSSPLTREYFFKNDNAADRVTLLGVWVNIVLSLVKFAGGVAFSSAVLVADAGHSLSDLFSDFVTLWAVQIARLPPDEDHPYGHGKFESLGALFLSLTLLATGVGVASWSYEQMQVVVSSAHAVAPRWEAMALALLSIVSKEWLFRVTKRVGDALNSQVVVANAWHHRSDAFSSVLSMLSIGVAIAFPELLIIDSACGIFISGMIILTGTEILLESVKQLSDSSDRSLVLNVERIVRGVEGVLGVQRVRARSVGSGSLVDLSVRIDGKISASSANVVAERVKWTVMQRESQVMDVMVRTQSATVVCPLLATQRRTSADIEQLVRSLVSAAPEIDSVSRVNVHFLDTGKVGIEAIVFPLAQASVDELKQAATRLRASITEEEDIGMADILFALQ